MHSIRHNKYVICKRKVGSWEHAGQVIAGQRSSPLSLHYPEREVCAARLPASRGALLSNTRAAQPFDRTSLVTPSLEWAGLPHADDGPYPAPHVHNSLPPHGSQAAATPPGCLRKPKPGSIMTPYSYAATHMGSVRLLSTPAPPPVL